MTFEQLQKARSDGSHSVYKKPNQEKKSGRANKNRYILACDLVKFVVWFCWFSSFLSNVCVCGSSGLLLELCAGRWRRVARSRSEGLERWFKFLRR